MDVGAGAAIPVLSEISALRAWSAAARERSGRVAFVPTMGALHAGHLSLIAAAKAACAQVVVSIYVNPTQFGPQEDLAAYPRDLAGDLRLAAEAGADVVFAPSDQVMYPRGAGSTWVEVQGLTEHLCGAFRPGHFRGVTTVVARLFNLVQADVAFFGEKDYQQVAVVRRMVEDLGMPIEVVSCPTVREADGLAMSSRNALLPASLRAQACVLYRGLSAARGLYVSGERRRGVLLSAATCEIALAPDARIQYVDLVDATTLEPQGPEVGEAVVMAMAVRLGAVRLIDNMTLGVGA